MKIVVILLLASLILILILVHRLRIAENFAGFCDSEKRYMRDLKAIYDKIKGQRGLPSDFDFVNFKTKYVDSYINFQSGVTSSEGVDLNSAELDSLHELFDDNSAISKAIGNWQDSISSKSDGLLNDAEKALKTFKQVKALMPKNMAKDLIKDSILKIASGERVDKALSQSVKDIASNVKNVANQFAGVVQNLSSKKNQGSLSCHILAKGNQNDQQKKFCFVSSCDKKCSKYTNAIQQGDKKNYGKAQTYNDRMVNLCYSYGKLKGGKSKCKKGKRSICGVPNWEPNF